jgi:alpha-tubulin suppressor-like RCC1 family protein
VWEWGYSFTPSANQLNMPSGVAFTMIAAGETTIGDYGIGLDTAGQAWSWGGSPSALVAAITGVRPSAGLAAIPMPSGVRFVSISGDSIHAVALDSEGRAWGWGRNPDGELGDGTTTNSQNPVAAKMPAGVRFTRVVAGSVDTYALDQNGHIWAWGSNSNGTLGNGTVQHSGGSAVNALPVAATAPPAVRFVALAGRGEAGFALDSLGREWAWGDDGSGQLGVGPAGDSPGCRHFSDAPCSGTPTPVLMPNGVTFTAIAAGEHNGYALDRNGHAWAWGSNEYGQLGIGTVSGPQMCGEACSRTPVAVTMPAGVRFTAIAGSDTHAVALDTTGLLWAFGANEASQLGTGTPLCPVRYSGYLETQPCGSTPVRVMGPSGVVFAGIEATHELTLAISGKPSG